MVRRDVIARKLAAAHKRLEGADEIFAVVALELVYRSSPSVPTLPH